VAVVITGALVMDIPQGPLNRIRLGAAGGQEEQREELLGRRVEIVIEKALNPYLRERVLREAVPFNSDKALINLT